MRPINLGEVIEVALHSPLVRRDLIHANSEINPDRNMQALKASGSEKNSLPVRSNGVFPTFI